MVPPMVARSKKGTASGKKLAALRERRGQIAQRQAGFDAERQIIGIVGEDAVDARHVHARYRSGAAACPWSIFVRAPHGTRASFSAAAN